jgi:preprotein translocase subunit YajC
VLISSAYAQAAGGSTQDTLMGLLPMILMFVVLYFLMVRPQMKKAKEHKTMVEALQKGDEVVSQGGIAGRIVKVDDNYVKLEVAPNVEITVQKAAVGMLLPKGTLKNL